MYALASCLASILRGTTVDQYGDAQDNSTVVASGVPMAIQDTTQRVWDPATQTPKVVHSIECSVQSNVDLRIGDQVRDDTNNVTYIVNNVVQPYGPAWTSDLDVDLKRITPAL